MLWLITICILYVCPKKANVEDLSQRLYPKSAFNFFSRGKGSRYTPKYSTQNYTHKDSYPNNQVSILSKLHAPTSEQHRWPCPHCLLFIFGIYFTNKGSIQNRLSILFQGARIVDILTETIQTKALKASP